jgi:AraC-like DNA-binding protein
MVPFHDMLRALDIGAKTMGVSSFGLVTADLNPMQFGAVGRIIAQSVSLFEACRNTARLVSLLNTSSHMWVSEVPDGILICREKLPGWQIEQYVLRHMVGLVQMAAGSNWSPSRVYLGSPKTNDLNDSELFANTIFHVGHPFLAVAVPKRLLSAGLKTGPDFATKASEKTLRETAASDDFVASVRRIIETILPDQYPNIEMISEAAGFSKRTLQRELAKEGVVYRDLVGQVRFKKACVLLVESDMSLWEIAHEIGYASDTHFVRAFRGWAGVTPGVHRAQIRPR